MKIVELAGQRFGRLLVLSLYRDKPTKGAHWKCVCDCGTQAVVPGINLRLGTAKSCGCLRREKSSERLRTHGLGNHPMYSILKGIKSRILDERDKEYKNYGGRGIKLCDRWDSLENFIEDMYPSWKEGLSIDRRDVDGNYCPENCRWATESMQGHGKRKRRGCTSKYFGVSLDKLSGKFVAQIKILGKVQYLGCFYNELHAALIYDNRSEELFGDRPNRTIRICSIMSVDNNS